MRVDHLVIVAFLKQGGDTESVIGSEKLLKKYQDRQQGRPISSHLVHVQPVKKWTAQKLADGAFEEGRHFEYEGGTGALDDRVARSDNVGVYLIFHGNAGSAPNVFEAQTRFKAASSMDKNATGVGVAQILSRLGVGNIRKLCLLMCNGATGDEAFVKHLCAGLDSVLGTRPMVAGWDSFISLNLATGGKVMNQADEATSAAFTAAHKMVYVYSGNECERRALRESGWSDKEQLATANPSCCTIF